MCDRATTGVKNWGDSSHEGESAHSAAVHRRHDEIGKARIGSVREAVTLAHNLLPKYWNSKKRRGLICLAAVCDPQRMGELQTIA